MNKPAPGGFLAYKQRIVYSLFRAAARVGLRLRVPLDEMITLLRMAAFEEARQERELDHASIAELIGKSLRTVSSLNRQYRSDFFAPERKVQFRRELAALLDREPLDLSALQARFPDRQDELPAALDDLVREGRILLADGTYRRNPEQHDFYAGADWMGRIDGLNRQMDILADTVWRRLVENDAQPVARSYVFSARDSDLDQLADELLERIRDRAIAADAAADDDAPTRGLTLAITTLENP